MKSALYRPARIAEPMSRDQIPTYDSSKTLGVQLIVGPSETSKDWHSLQGPFLPYPCKNSSKFS